MVRSVYVRMKMKKKIMEILNLLIGFELIIIGLIYLAQVDYASAASWSIFGCMYIVMDKYSILENMSAKRKIVENTKYAAAWLGTIICTVFLGYVIYTF